jgi:hypothetical protein
MSSKPPRSRKNLKSKNTRLIGNLLIALAMIIAAFVTGIFGWYAATDNWQQKARDNGWIPKDECLQFARANGWIPKNECRCSWTSYPGQGKDDAGKSIGIKINILSQDYRWQYGKVDELVEFGGKTESVRPHLSSLDISGSKAIVCVGAASVEGERSEQKELALARAKKLKDLVDEQLMPKVPVLTLNLGRAKYGEIDPRDQLKNATQRRVIIVEIVDQEKDVNLKQALFRALVQARVSTTPIPFDVRDYFDFDLEPLTIESE